MTLPELLEELKAVDPDTAEDIGNVVNVISIKSDGSFTLDAYYPDFIIQGCIQRACEKRVWTWCIYKQTPDEKHSHSAEISEITPGYDGDCYNQYHESCIAEKAADTPGEALLAAYIEAMTKKEHQYYRCCTPRDSDPIVCPLCNGSVKLLILDSAVQGEKPAKSVFVPP